MCGHPRDWSACRGASGRSWPPVGPAGPSRRAFESVAAQGGEAEGAVRERIQGGLREGKTDPRVQRERERESRDGTTGHTKRKRDTGIRRMKRKEKLTSGDRE